MIDIYFNIDKNNHIARADSTQVIGKNSIYLCHFNFAADNSLSTMPKYAQFTNTNKETYVAMLGTDPEPTCSIPFQALSGCTLKISIYGGEGDEVMFSTDSVTLLVIPSGYTPTLKAQSTQPEFTDAFIETYNHLSEKFDDAELVYDNIVFYGNDEVVAVLSLESFAFELRGDWNEDDPDSYHFIKNKPTIPQIQDNLIEDDERKFIDGLSKNQGIIINNTKMDNDALDDKLTKTMILERDSIIDGIQYYAGDIITYTYSPDEI